MTVHYGDLVGNLGNFVYLLKNIILGLSDHTLFTDLDLRNLDFTIKVYIRTSFVIHYILYYIYIICYTLYICMCIRVSAKRLLF